MIVKRSEEIVVVIGIDDVAKVYYRSEFDNPTTTTDSAIVRWEQWLDILTLAEQTPALQLAIEQAELLYNLTRKK